MSIGCSQNPKSSPFPCYLLFIQYVNTTIDHLMSHIFFVSLHKGHQLGCAAAMKNCTVPNKMMLFLVFWSFRCQGVTTQRSLINVNYRPLNFASFGTYRASRHGPGRAAARQMLELANKGLVTKRRLIRIKYVAGLLTQ